MCNRTHKKMTTDLIKVKTVLSVHKNILNVSLNYYLFFFVNHNSKYAIAIIFYAHEIFVLTIIINSY